MFNPKKEKLYKILSQCIDYMKINSLLVSFSAFSFINYLLILLCIFFLKKFRYYKKENFLIIFELLNISLIIINFASLKIFVPLSYDYIIINEFLYLFDMKKYLDYCKDYFVIMQIN